ncbi:MAG: DUF1501 domain-containing protein, partial [Planctomycetaceae bacterium]|nr:DUF1501 domain-containing protein [Planctomycetaceae bacterium]
MLNFAGPGGQWCDGLSRRNFLTVGGLGLGGASLAGILRAESQQPPAAKSPRAVIMVLLPGGPTHLDWLDLKPEAPAEIRGELNPIASSVPGISLCELLPRTARLMDRMAIVRTLVGARNDHNIHQCITGWESHPQQPASAEVPGYPPGGWPSLGAVLSKVHGPGRPGMPASVDLTPVHYDARFVTSAPPGQAGYLGPAHAGFEVQSVDRSNIVLNGISTGRLSQRQALRTALDSYRRQLEGTGPSDGLDEFHRQAFELLTSSRLSAALDITREGNRTRSLYGLNPAGSPLPEGGDLLEQFLVARRVIQAGARCVTLCFSRWPFGRMSQGDYNWDWHKNIFSECRSTLPLLDAGVAGLVTDLEQQGLLDDVAVVVWGEFGRTPKINGNAGRDHWPGVASALLAGGGIRGGQVVGQTSRYAEEPIERPVHFREVFATLYHLMGVDPA